MNGVDVPRVRVRRDTAETAFAITLGPRSAPCPGVQLPNRLLGHMLDHLTRACGLALDITTTEWPGSWQFDHVLCEDLGQLTGRGIAACHDALRRRRGVRGRASTETVMDDAAVRVTVGLESRPRVDWSVEGDIDGFVDAWFDERGAVLGWTTGTSLRQFVDGFALGAGACVAIDITRCGNLHHVYECVFRALGDVIRMALNLDPALPGDGCGLAGKPRYQVEVVDDA